MKKTLGTSVSVGVLGVLLAAGPVQALAPQRQVSVSPAPAERTAERVEVLGSRWTVRRDAESGQVSTLMGGVTAKLGGTPESAARAFLAGAGPIGLRKAQADQLVHVETRRSPAGFHVTFRQHVTGRAVVGGWVRVHLTPELAVQMATNQAKVVQSDLSQPPVLDAGAAIAAATQAVGVTALRADARAALEERVSGGDSGAVFTVQLPAEAPLGDFEVQVDARSGRVLSVENRLQHASARVFDPNPCVSLANAALKDLGDAAPAVPDAAYRTVTIEGLDDSGFLRGAFVDLSASTGGGAKEATGEFSYSRNDKRFEQAMVYHHIDRAQRYIQSLGFDSVQNRQQRADAHGTTADNSFYSPMTKALTFGDGGVDDAEDADVIMHEYGHAIQDNQVPGWGQNREGRAMGEGFGDYWAASVRSDSGFHPEAVAIWDATAYSSDNPPNLRRLDSTKLYPQDMQQEEHADGEIWSACLWQLRGALGRTDADKLVLQAHFFLSPSAGFADGADALLQADRALFAGAHQDAIRKIFVDRGILAP